MDDRILDKDTATMLSALSDLNIPSLIDMTVDQARVTIKATSALRGAATPIYDVAYQTIPSESGDIPIRIYRPSADENLAVVVFYHGGGWVLCDLDTHDEVARKLANDTQCIVVSVDYRLAPEHKFPAAMDDAYAALCWVADHCEQLGADKNRLAVAGDSAGGNLAAVVCLRAREEGGPAICYQSLWYPVTNIETLTTESYSKFSEGYSLERAGMQWFKDHYIRNDSDAADPYVSPLLSSSLADLPNAFVMSAGFDVLRDDGALYADALKREGVQVHYINFNSLIHGFMNTAKIIPAAGLAFDEVVNDLKNNL